MKLTKDTLTKAASRASVSSENLIILYNWSKPSDLTDSQYNTAISGHSLLFNNLKTGFEHFFQQDLTKLTASSLSGLSISSTNNAISSSGYGTFSQTDLIKISKDVNYSNWTVFINFEELGCSDSPDKRRILLSSKGSTTTSGFNLGINGAKNLFYEFYDSGGNLKTYTILSALAGRNIIAVSKSDSLKNISIYIFNSIDFTVEKLLIIADSPQLGSKWYLGGSSPAPLTSSLDKMFQGKIYEFVLLSSFLSKEQIIEMCQSFLLDGITNEGFQTFTETYYKTLSFTEQQVQTGTRITGHTTQAVTIQKENGTSMTLYEEVPVTVPVYETRVSYVQDTLPSTRQVEKMVSASKTYDFNYIKNNYAPTCFLLNTPQSSAVYEVYSCNKYTTSLNKKGSFVSSLGYFNIEENYSSEKSIVVYLNGLLQELGVNYIRDGINIKKYSGNYSSTDILVYDVIDNGTQSFQNHSGGTGILMGEAGKDLYLNGLKLIYGQDYQDQGNNVFILKSLAAGKLGIISRYGDLDFKTNGIINVYKCSSTHSLISEQLWINGLKKLKNVDYFLKNPCDLINSDITVPKKTVVIYENNQNYFNI